MRYQNEDPIVGGYQFSDPESVGDTALGRRASQLVDEDASELMRRLELQLLINTENARTSPIDFAIDVSTTIEAVGDEGVGVDSDELLLVVNDMTAITTPDINRMHAVAPPHLASAVPGLASRVFRRLNREVFQLLCSEGSEADRAQLRSALGMGEKVVAGYLSTVLVGLGIAIPIALIVATLIAKYILEPTVDELCSYWQAQLDVVPG